MSKPTALLADDHPNFLEKVEKLLDGAFEIVERVLDGQALVEAAEKLKPDVIVTDISMPLLDGIEAMKRLKKSGCKSKFVFLTVHTDPEFARACFLCGALGYVVKTRMNTDLKPATEAALAGHIFASPNFQQGTTFA